MNRFVLVFFLALTVLLVGCTAPDLKYTDLKPATTATVTGDTVTIHLGSDMMNSACYPQPKARVENGTVYGAAYRSLREQSRELVVRLPASASAQNITVVWVNPDKSHVTVPTSKR